MATSNFTSAIQQLAREKGLPEDTVTETVEAALAAAYRKDYGKPSQVIKISLTEKKDAPFQIFQVFEVVATEEEIEDKDRQVTLEDAQAMEPSIEVGQELEVGLPFHDDFGRIAAQTAKQVIIQRLREAERDVLFAEFKDKEHQLLSVQVQQVEGENVIVTAGKVTAVMPPREQIRGEYYNVGQRIRVFVKEVADNMRGPQIIVSRADARFIQELFSMEVPEIQAGTVEIKSIAREAGARTKLAVYAENEALDPVGSCVGQRGTRVQAVLSEVGEEKIDIILWNEDSEQFIRNALSPAKVRTITIDEDNRVAKIEVDEDQLSLAIGKSGQNVRLASKLTGYSLDILRDQPTETTSTDKESPEESSESEAETAKP